MRGLAFGWTLYSLGKKGQFARGRGTGRGRRAAWPEKSLSSWVFCRSTQRSPGAPLKIVMVAFVFGSFARKRNVRRLESLVLECKHGGSESDLGGTSFSP